MVLIASASSIWQQLANLCFLLSGVFSDLLLIRFFVAAAYVWLLITGVLGHSQWTDVITQPRSISLDTIIWSIVSLYVHLSSLVMLLYDERRIKMEKDEAALWRVFYRYSGLSQRLFKEYLSEKFDVVEFTRGSEIPTKNCIYIILEGTVQAESFYGGKADHFQLVSADMFDISTLPKIMPVRAVFAGQKFHGMVSSDVVRLFRFYHSEIERMARNPLAKSAWQGLLIATLARIAERRYRQEQHVHRDSIFDPLEEWEEPSAKLAGSGHALMTPLAHLWYTFRMSFLPPTPCVPWVPGVRQANLPAPSKVNSVPTNKIVEQANKSNGEA